MGFKDIYPVQNPNPLVANYRGISGTKGCFTTIIWQCLRSARHTLNRARIGNVVT